MQDNFWKFHIKYSNKANLAKTPEKKHIIGRFMQKLQIFHRQ